MDLPSDYDNIDVMLGGGNTYSTERELANIINGSACYNNPGPFLTQEEMNHRRIRLGTLMLKMKFISMTDYLNLWRLLKCDKHEIFSRNDSSNKHDEFSDQQGHKLCN